MDKRILDKLNAIKEQEKEKHNEEIRKNQENEAREKAYIESKVPEARKWVEERLLNLIAEEIAKPYLYDGNHRRIEKSLDLDCCDKNDNGNRNIPGEAKAIAAAEIEGLSVRKQWHAEINEIDFSCPEHYSYNVTWE